MVELAKLAKQHELPHFADLANKERICCVGAEWYAHKSADTVDTSQEDRERRWGKLDEKDLKLAWEKQLACKHDFDLRDIEADEMGMRQRHSPSQLR